MEQLLRQNALIERMKSEIADEYGVDDFEEIDRGEVTSRANGDIVRTLVELDDKSDDKI